MKINSLELLDFRNYGNLNLTGFSNINIVIGSNGVGKTNIVEAIYLLSLARSLRPGTNRNLIRFGQDFARISANIQTNRNHNLELVIGKDFKRAKIDKMEMEKISDFVGILNVVAFTPDDLNLVKGSPQIKRRFLNLELSKISPIYLFGLNKFNYLLKERNKYLKMASRYDEYLEVIDEQLIKLQLDIEKKRCDFVGLLAEIVQPVYKKIAGNDDIIKLELESAIDFRKNKEELLQQYQNNFVKDKREQKTSLGVHRDNLKININSKDAFHFGSQGQIRTIVLSVKIALVELIKQEIGEYPVLLLDDVMSELDPNRQNNLLNFLSQDIQTFITTTSFDGLIAEIIENAHNIHIKGVNDGR